MNIAYITPRIPFPPMSGGTIKTLTTIQALIHEGHSISLFCFGPKHSQPLVQKLLSLGVRSVSCFPRELVAEKSVVLHGTFLLKSLVNRTPYTLEKFSSFGLKLAIDDFCTRERPNIVWIDHFNLISYVPSFFQGKTILEEHKIQSLLFSRLAHGEQHPLKRPIYLMESTKWEGYERLHLSRFSVIATISDTDKQYLAKKYQLSTLSHLGIAIPVSTKQSIRKKQILFIGTLTWKPNRDGLHWFLQYIWPNVHHQFPHYRLLVVGDYLARPPAVPGVSFLGSVAQIEKYFLESCMMICPIFSGSGIRIKILQALAHGLPVVSTTLGAEGIPVENGSSILLADSSPTFIAALGKLLTDIRLQGKLSRGGKSVIQRHYSSSVFRERLHAVIA